MKINNNRNDSNFKIKAKISWKSMFFIYIKFLIIKRVLYLLIISLKLYFILKIYL